jgi:hypothetical protein
MLIFQYTEIADIMKKKRLLIFMSLTVIGFLLIFAGCSKGITDKESLIEKAREEMPISNSEDTDIVIAGTITEKKSVLIWFVSGNTYQEHCYTPIEFEMSDDSSYIFKKTYKPINRGEDIAVLHWKNGLSVIVNNTKCTTLRIEDNSGTHDEKVGKYPYVFYTSENVMSYAFLDGDGNEL